VQVTHIRERPGVLSFNAYPEEQEEHNEFDADIHLSIFK
jgi:hypothetical protein